MSAACVYRHFDKNGVLLYVGVSANVLKRISQHVTASFWFKDISRIDIQHYERECEAHAAERKAIRAEKPKHNKQFAPIRKECYSGFMGVSWIPETSKWRARFAQYGKGHMVGDDFETPESAHAAILDAKQKIRLQRSADLTVV